MSARASVEEDVEIVSLMDSTVQTKKDGESDMSSVTGNSQINVILWLVSAPIAIATSWHIFWERNYHHPLHLHFLQMLFATVVVLARSVFEQKCEESRYEELWPRWFTDRRQLTEAVRSNVCPRLASLALAWSLPLFLKAVDNSENLPTMVMLSLVAFLVEFFLGQATLYQFGQLNLILRVLVIGLACVIIPLEDYRSNSKPLKFAVHAFVLMGVVKLLLTYNRRLNAQLSDMKSLHRQWKSIVGFAIPASAVLTFIWATTRKDRMDGFTELYKLDPIVLMINLAASTVAILTGGSLSVFSNFSGSQQGLDEIAENYTLPPSQVFASCLVGVLSITCAFPSLVTGTQILAFLVGFFFMASPREYMVLARTRWAEARRYPVTEGSECTTCGFRSWKKGILLLLPLATWCLLAIWTFFKIPVAYPESYKPRLDWAYEPSSQLDIVVSMYKEQTWEVRSIVSALEEIPTIYNRHPRVIIYTKDPDADLAALKLETGAAEVTKLPNVGRESHTFLHHILSSWDNLAAQTLFIQAEVHMVDAFLARIRDYYLPSTGMMALGYSGRTCDCNDCGDRDWHDTNPNKTIASVYERVHNQTCDRALMSYRGQFIASARRIRAVDPAIYEDLSRDLSVADTWSFKDEFRYDVDRVNTVDAPQFGYTVERLWNILFQCSDPYVAWLCPSFENGISRWGSRRDCQCFDY